MKTNASEFYAITRTDRDHLDALLPIYQEFLVYYHDRYGHLLRGIALEENQILEYLRTQCDTDQSVIFFATLKATPQLPAGFLMMSRGCPTGKHRTTWAIKNLFVTPAQRGKGIASRLVGEALDYCQIHKGNSITLVTGRINTEARSLYEKCGFVNDSTYEDEQNVKYELRIS